MDVLLNLLLFIPFAAGLRLSGVSWRRVVLLSALLSATVESLQFALLPGRDASFSDLLTNTLSGGFGAALAGRRRGLLVPGPRAASRMATTGAFLWLGLLAGTAWLAEPWVPEGPLDGSWGHGAHNRPPFNGTVQSAELSGAPLPDGPVAEWRGLASRIRAGRMGLEVEILSGEPTTRWAPIVSLLNQGDPVLALHQAGRDLAFEYPVRAVRLLLRAPAVRVTRALPPGSGLQIRLSAGARGHTIWVSVEGAGAATRNQVTLRPTLGWALLLPFDYGFDSREPFLTALWIAGLLLPVGYWARRATGSPGGRWWALVPCAAVLLGIGLVPALFGYPPEPVSDWLAAIAGAAIGWVLAPVAAYLEPGCPSPSIGEFSSS